MPLIRRLPKYGFQNPFRITYSVVNVRVLSALEINDTITPQILVDAGLVKRKTLPIKVLGSGEITKPIIVQAHKFSKSALEKIQAAGGRAEVIGGV
jgi:large subunit ribosomal protein L15